MNNKKVLFVCLGNICRSPTAEGIFAHLVNQAGLQDKILIDSCGTSGHHEGEESDPRMQNYASKRGYNLTSIARGIQPKDLEEFDYIITMDDSNFNNVKAIAKGHNTGKIKKMTDFCTHSKIDHVPDPYYGGPEGFELVIDILEDACAGLLQQVQKDLGKA